MAIYVITAPPGGGKSLFAAAEIVKAIGQGRPVACNYDLYLDKFADRYDNHQRIYRIPAKPTRCDLDAIGNGNTSYDETKNGILILDECGSWLNAHSWNEKGRAEVNDWFRHSRKLGWDVYLIVQHIDILDKQARTSMCEHLVVCRRLDRMKIPFISFLAKLIGIDVKGPRMHVANIRYGSHEQAPLVDRRWYRATPEHTGIYDTKATFFEDGRGVATLLPTYYLVGRYMAHPSGVLLMLKNLIRRLNGRPPIQVKRPVLPTRRVGGTDRDPVRLVPSQPGTRVKIEPHHNAWIYDVRGARA